jgi:hypothetical protein
LNRLATLGSPAFIIALGLVCSGCSMMSWRRDKEVVHVVDDAAHPVAEILCLWSPAEGHDMNGLPCRGFAGQVLFFTAGNRAPAVVSGDVMIYVFDDHGTAEEQQKPLHQFSFPHESWETYLRETNFGSSYQLFIPYTRATSESANCSLRLRYTSPDKRITFSKLVEIALPGTPRTQPPISETPHQPSLFEALDSSTGDASRDSASSVSQASYVVPADNDSRPGGGTSRDSDLVVSSSQIELQPAQLANHQLATLDHLVQSLDGVSVRPADSGPAISEALSQEASAHEAQALDSSAVDVTDGTESAPTAMRSHRLHPLASEPAIAP